MSRKKQAIAVIGLDTFGSTIAKELTRFGDHVIGIDIDEARVRAHADIISQAIIVDSRDEEALREAGVGECDAAVVALASDLEASVVTALNLRMIGVEKVWAKALSKTHHRILSKLGVDRVIHPEQDAGLQIAQVLHNPMVRDYVALGNGYYVVSFVIPESLEDRKLSDLHLMDEFEIRCVGVMRGTDFVGSDTMNCTLSVDDRLLLLGKRVDLRDFASSL